MDNIKRNIIVLLSTLFVSTLLLTNCNRQAELDVQLNNNVKEFDYFPEQTAVIFNELVEYTKGIPNNIIFTDSVLIICNMNKSISAFIYTYNLKSKSLSDGFIKVGRGPNEAIGGFGSGLQNNILWMYDGTMSRVLTIDKSSVLNGEQPPTIKTYSINNRSYYKIVLVDSLSFIADGDWTSKYKIQHVDLLTNKKIDEYV